MLPSVPTSFLLVEPQSLRQFIFCFWNVYQLILLSSNYGRWEDGLADRLQYDADGSVKTEIVKTPFVQVYHTDLCYLSTTLLA